MTTVQRVAQIFGIVFIVVGIAGFFSSGMSMDADAETATKLLGLFPVNVLHNIVHLLFGAWGLVASRTFDSAVAYCRYSGLAYLGLAVLGLFAPDLFGLVPIGGHDIWLHVVLGLVLAAVGFTARADTPRATTVA